MLDMYLPQTLTDDNTVQQQAERTLILHVGNQQWVGISQAAKDGYYAGRKHHRDMERMDDEKWGMLYEQGKMLPWYPESSEFSEYIHEVRPPHYTPQAEREWSRYFLLGWYSRVFLIDYCQTAEE